MIVMESKEQLGAEIRQKLAEIEVVAAALQQREEDLEDEINDMFAGVAAALEDRRRSVLAQLRSRVEGKCKRLGGRGESEDDITADDLLFAETQSEQLRQRQDGEAEAGAEAGEVVVVVETPHVSVSWAGLDEVKQLAASLGEVTSSSCIPAVSTVGGWRLLMMYYILLSTDIYC